MTSKGETKTQHYYKTQITSVFTANAVVLQEHCFSLTKQQERSQQRSSWLGSCLHRYST